MKSLAAFLVQVCTLVFSCMVAYAQPFKLDSLKKSAEAFGGSRTEAALEARLNYAVKLARINAKASDSIIQLLERFPESKRSPYFYGRLLSIKADLQEEAGDRLGATRLYQQVYQIGDSIRSDRLLKSALTGLGSVEIPKGNMQKGIGYCLRAIGIVQRMKPIQHSDLAKLYYNIGLAHAYQNRLDSSEANFKTALYHAEKAKFNNVLGLSHAGMAMVWLKKGDIGKGLSESKRALFYLEKEKDHRQMIGSLNTVGICYLQLNDYKQAENYFRQATDLSKLTNSAITRIQILSNLGLALEKQKKWEDAYWILDQAYTLKDTLFDSQSEKDKLALETRFDVKLQEKDIALLTKQKENQALLIDRQHLVNRGLSAFGLMAVALAFVFYRNGQLRKKTNELLLLEKNLEQRIRQRLEKENKELLDKNLKTQFEMLKSQVNPHFLFNSLNSLSSLIRLDVNRAEQFVEELSSVYRYLLKSNESQLIRLSEEMEFIQSYVHLLKTRFGDALQFSVQIPGPAFESQIPPLTLQLLVENAIKHNVVSMEEPLRLTIHQPEPGFLEVVNNLKRKTQSVISHKIGLTNIMNKYHMLGLDLPEVGEDELRFWVRLPLV